MDDDPLRRLQDLQRDLISFTESRLANVDRLNAALDATIDDFRKLLERSKRNKASRDALQANPIQDEDGTKYRIVLNGAEWSINNDFRDGVIIVADKLDLDELEAARYYLQEQRHSTEVPEILTLRTVLRFHKQRETLLQCLRMLTAKATDSETDDNDASVARSILNTIIHESPGPSPESAYWRRCIDGLSDIEQAIKSTQDHVQMMNMTGQSFEVPDGEALQAVRMLLTHQHEALVSIMVHLIKERYVKPEDYRAFLSKAAVTEISLDVMSNYSAILLSGSYYFGSNPDTQDDAAFDLHKLFAPGPGQLQWKMKQMQAASAIWWLAALSGRAAEAGLTKGAIEKLEEDRKKMWEDSCKSKAFHYMLSVVEFLSPEVWYDPAKAALVGFLLNNSFPFPPDATAPSRDFALLVLREFQVFVDSFVNSMPDFLRRMARQEDNERRNFVPTPLEPDQNQSMDLERFMLVIAGSYKEDPEAAQDFWSDAEGYLQGFLIWASQKLPTPRVAAFCEMLRALANDERSANHAHRFLLAEKYAMNHGGKCGVTWTQIFTEVELYAAANQRKPTLVQSAPSMREEIIGDPDIQEKETPIMLEAYLRLATHVCESSPEARNWILRVQPFHIHDQLLQLVSSATDAHVQACCFDLLAALTIEKTAEVNAGLWNALDIWIAGGGQAGSGIPRAQPSIGFRPPSQKQYLQLIGKAPEVATAFVRLLIALIVPVSSEPESTLDSLPFPEALGASHRHIGIEPYVDFVLGQVFTQPQINDGLRQNRMLTNVLRHACLTFAHLCLSTFNEDLIVLANKTNLPVDSAIRAKSLADYIRLHPFARTMEHLFNDNTIAALFSSLHQSLAELETMSLLSPLTQTTLKAVQVINLTMKLQPTYFDIVRPLIKTRSTSRSDIVANAAIASFDEVMLTQLDAVTNIETFAACDHNELALESLDLLKRLSSSRRLTSIVDTVSGQRVGNRLVGRLGYGADAFATILKRGFEVDEIDLEIDGKPLKVEKATAILDLLTSSIDASPNMPGIAHSLLGLLHTDGRIRASRLQDDSLFAHGSSLFHIIAQGAVDIPTTFKDTNVFWLLALKSGCTEVVTKLAVAPMTASLIQEELRTMEFLPAMAINLLQTPTDGPWDGLPAISPETLMQSAGGAIRDLMRIREAYFEYAALEVKGLSTTYKKSILEKDVRALLGTFVEEDIVLPTASLLTLIDFFDIVLAEPLEASRRYFADLDLTSCVVESPQALLQVDIQMAEQYLLLRKLELWQSGTIKDPIEEHLLNDEIAAILAGLRTSNLHSEIAKARSDATEAWTDALSTVVTVGGLAELERTHLAVQALQVVLPRFEKALSDSVDAAGLFARLTLTLVHAASVAAALSDRQVAINREDRLSAAFRISVKAITDSETGPALRDVCYRTCCTVLAFTPTTPTGSNNPSNLGFKQLAQQVQTSGERILRVITEDSFSGRGSTRVSALLCLDAFLSLFRTARATTSILRALTKLNFVPVLIDNSIGSIEAAFRGDEKDLPTMLAYFHTALALLLNLCSTADGTQLILNSGFLTAVSDSQLFSTDPDIGLDVNNPAALREFCRILASVLRVITAAVATKGPGNAATLQQAKAFLTQHRFSVQAVFKRTSRIDKSFVKPEAEATEVADEFAKLMLLTDFLEDDEPAYARSVRSGGFS